MRARAAPGIRPPRRSGTKARRRDSGRSRLSVTRHFARPVMASARDGRSGRFRRAGADGGRSPRLDDLAEEQIIEQELFLLVGGQSEPGPGQPTHQLADGCLRRERGEPSTLPSPPQSFRGAAAQHQGGQHLIGVEDDPWRGAFRARGPPSRTGLIPPRRAASRPPPGPAPRRPGHPSGVRLSVASFARIASARWVRTGVRTASRFRVATTRYSTGRGSPGTFPIGVNGFLVVILAGIAAGFSETGPSCSRRGSGEARPSTPSGTRRLPIASSTEADLRPRVAQASRSRSSRRGWRSRGVRCPLATPAPSANGRRAIARRQ